MSNNKSRRPKAVFALALIVVGAVITGVWLAFLPNDPVELTRESLDLRKGVLVVKSTGLVFDGILVDYFPDHTLHSAVEIRSGQAEGVTRGWYESGQIEVEETFVRGVSHGTRRRWHANGQLKSIATIVHGKITDRYREWHDNGLRAAEVTMADGQPQGVSEAWDRLGKLKARVEHQSGQVVSKDYLANESAL
ncbi:MAG: antitoxin component YwqK of YwqJK toxin-antitoxin module [Verrucomicrobiales bacterium]|jgi:antitoxin component YwqK of YwqJK toxin-antitoxin module